MPQSALVLGLNSTHPDASAVLAGPRGVIAAIAEERISRRKHDAAFPRNAIAEVLRIAGASPSDITDIAVARDPRANLGAKLGFIAKRPRVGLSLVRNRLRIHRSVSNSGDTVAAALGVAEDSIRARFHRVEHHLAHIASAFFWSPFERAAGISVDGSGDFATAMIARCEGTRIDVLHRSLLPHSLGIYYTTLCQFLGFDKYGEEYKVMGLSAYGSDRYAQQLRPLVSFDGARGIRLDQAAFRTYSDVYDRAAHEHAGVKDGDIALPRMWGDALIGLFGPARVRGTPLTQRDMDLSASMQRHFESVYLSLVAEGVRRAGCRDAVMAGGCALNGVANGLLFGANGAGSGEPLVDRLYTHPAAGDDGTAAGAAAYVLHSVLAVPRAPEVVHAYWGTGWTDEQIEKDVAASGLPFQRFDRAGLLNAAAGALASGKIIGWFQGREEWGPRALGNRSILCHPGWPDMKAILNARVKNRETFRPFAPAVLAERLSDCFEGSHEVPFMNIVYKVRPEWRERLSATTHEDHTGRVQTVRRDQNDLYYDLISAFRDRTGVPVLLNTSFNENEPIVHTPKHAIDCFKRTRMDALAVGPFWYQKPADEAERGEAV